jgi:predicted glycogen debranching enzyme
MKPPNRTISPARPEPSPPLEWLVTNGLGGYASGTVAGFATRRYHGLLIAALPAPLGRTMMLNDCVERLTLPDGSEATLGVDQPPAGPLEPGAGHLVEFRLEAGLPVWRYEVGGLSLEKRVVLSHLQNTTRVTYRLLEGGGPARLSLRPAVHFRGHDDAVDAAHPDRYALTASGDRYEVSGGRDLPPLRLTLVGRPSTFLLDSKTTPEIQFSIEASRGYKSTGSRWSAGYFRVELAPGESVTLVASTEPWEVIDGLDPGEAARCESDRRSRLVSLLGPRAYDPVAAGLALAADQFLITPAGRVEDTARAHASGEEVRTVIAGYHWFTDWGRDTMISLEGLTLSTGRVAEAGYILRTFAFYIRDGLIPNLFPEGGKGGLYHTSDATLWFFHAIGRYLAATDDRATLDFLVPKLLDVVDHHLKGTHFGIGVDPADGLLRQGREGYQLTWMDAKVDGWVVTPRRGKAVEINALWYNALMLLKGWLDGLGRPDEARAMLGHAEKARASFNRRFWFEGGGYLYDVVDAEDGGDDPACRPNQLFAISLDYPVLDRSRWEAVVTTCRDRLLTPVGLRSLAPGHPDYKPTYHGDLRTRDAAYHQGTVWSWLIGPYVDARLKLHADDREGARALLVGLVAHLDDAAVGSVSEVFDAEAPFTPRGCIAQAWGVAELLRCWIKTS